MNKYVHIHTYIHTVYTYKRKKIIITFEIIVSKVDRTERSIEIANISRNSA